MAKIYSENKKIDDAVIYFEICASGLLAENFDNVFADGKFTAPADNVIVFLHGNSEDGATFAKTVDDLCEKYYCIVPDTRGHGKSTAGNSEFTIDLLAEDLSKLCDELNLGHFKLIGFSDGANIALTYTVRHPERPSTLIVAGANINPRGLNTRFLINTKIKCFFAKQNMHKNEKAKLKYGLLSLMADHPHINPRLLKNITCPVLVMDAERDLIKKSHTDLIAASIQNPKRVTVPDSTHDVFFSNPDFTISAIKEFLS